MTGPSRRHLLAFAGASVAATALAGCARGADGAPVADTRPLSAVGVPADGRRQAGVETPAPPHQLTVVHDLKGDPATVLAALGHTILALTAGTDPRLAGMPPGDLTVTVGVGPDLVRTVDPALPGAQNLPRFPREHPSPNGDLLLTICASDPLLLPGAAAALTATGGHALREQWRQVSFRGPTVSIGGASAPRNLLGFVDGIVNPHSAADFDKDIWLAGPAKVTDATIAVVRRMELDVARFLALSTAEQEAVFGRRRDTAAPLSGGDAATPVDLGAKTPTGEYLIPADAHLRRAHPGATGVPTMFRRSYSFSDATAAGLLFVSFQNRLDTFTRTLQRMSESDALLGFSTTTRSGTFLILPGFSSSRPLGSTLFR
jgi:dye decolorizing peroxidase